jgi:hypothetical protein
MFLSIRAHRLYFVQVRVSCASRSTRVDGGNRTRDGLRIFLRNGGSRSATCRGLVHGAGSVESAEPDSDTADPRGNEGRAVGNAHGEQAARERKDQRDGEQGVKMRSRRDDVEECDGAEERAERDEEREKGQKREEYKENRTIAVHREKLGVVRIFLLWLCTRRTGGDPPRIRVRRRQCRRICTKRRLKARLRPLRSR